MNPILKAFLIYYLTINLILFFAMAYDKACAKRDIWRVPESSLFIISLLGGGIGGFCGMFLFHHKNKKPQFYIIYLISLALHAALLYLVFTKFI